MAADPQTIVNAAVCIECNVPIGMQLPVLISLFARIAGVSADPQSLVNGATCIECDVPPGMMLPVLISLAAQIAAGGTGTAQVSSGVGAPVAAPGTATAIYIDTSTGTKYYYYAGAWH